MESIKSDWSLKGYNTFGIDVTAKYFVEVASTEALVDCLEWADSRNVGIFMLGGGSNILFTKDLNQLVLKNDITGFEILKEDDVAVDVKIGGGEIWHEVVLDFVDRGWGGVENLSLIPGSVGAAPIQNIGAYGVEFKDVFVSLEALNLNTRKIELFEKSECEFGYRTSIFKTHQKGNYIITSVTIRLSKKPTINTDYGAINDVLAKQGILSPSIKDVSDTVIAIRSSKLPDPKKIGNSGSFFKNPVIAKSVYDELQKKYGAPGYLVNDLEVKVPAGWLIEHANWKGKRVGAVGVHEHQALVLVNYGGGTGDEILSLSKIIQQSVNDKFGVVIEREVNVI